MDLDPNQQAELEIKDKTSRLVFTPEFIPYYVDVKKAFGISHVATLIYGFIRFFLRSNEEFYFTNKQLGDILDISEDRAGKCFMELQDKEVVKVNYRIKGGGGKVRFVDWVYGRTVENNYSNQLETPTPSSSKQPYNKNKLKENKDNQSYIGEAEEILTYWNDKHKTKYKSLAGITDNVGYWLKFHPLEDIKSAIDKIPYHKWWADKMTPQILFRKKNPRGEAVDYIEELLNTVEKAGYNPKPEEGKYAKFN